MKARTLRFSLIVSVSLFGLSTAWVSAQEPKKDSGKAQALPKVNRDAVPQKPVKSEFEKVAEKIEQAPTKPKPRPTKTGEGGPARPKTVTGPDGKPIVKVTVNTSKYPEHIIASGDRMALIARKHYGNSLYGPVLGAYNDLDPRKLKVGQIIKIPDLNEIFDASGLHPVMEEECNHIITARKQFMEIEPTLIKIAKKQEKLDEATTEKLSECYKGLFTAMRQFKTDKEGIVKTADSVAVQLRTGCNDISHLKKGSFQQKHVDRVHQRIGLAMTYAIIWARDGFK